MQNVRSPRSRLIAEYVLYLAMFPVACRAAPSVDIAGAYFPAWLACALVAVVGAIAARAAMVATGLARVMPLQLFVCTSIGLLVAVLVWAAWIGI